MAVGLMLVWVLQDGGYDASTWYWGALILLSTLALVCFGSGGACWRVPRVSALALTALGLYVVWSYVSIAWARSPGDALQGSNRALLYLILFALVAVLPWTPEGALAALLTFVLGVGAVALVLLLRLASADHVQQLVVAGRLVAPTGYFNSSVALFTIDALAATALATRRELPGPVRGALIAVACAGLQLAVIGESRGWLFTLPLVLLVVLIVLQDRLRVAVVSIIPIAAVLVPLHRLLGVFDNGFSSTLGQAAMRAGRVSLLICAVAFVAGTLIAWADTRLGIPHVFRVRRRAIGAIVAAVAVTAGGIGALAATHDDPIGFVQRQWNGFSHPAPVVSHGPHFTTVGSGRYDFWRVSIDALAAHPLGGLGQDNFADYYITRRRTREEPQWTHSLEMRLLAQTGLIGFGLFAAFLVAAMIAAVRNRRHGGELVRFLAGAAVIPVVVWTVHGSVDWFWEMPALSGPALGFLAMAGALARPPTPQRYAPPIRLGLPRAAALAGGMLLLVAAVVVLGFPYLSAREVSTAAELRAKNSAAALSDLATAARLNPLSAEPARLGGAIALQTGQFAEAERRFRQAISREPGGWFSWLGDGLAASALGDPARAQHDYRIAASIDSLQPAVTEALARVKTAHPLTAAAAFQLIMLA